MNHENGESDFLELVCRYLDGHEMSTAQWADLNGQLSENRSRRETFVRLCLQAKLIAEVLPIGDTVVDDDAILTETCQADFAKVSVLWDKAEYGRTNYFSQSAVFSYVVATLLFAVGLLAGSLITVTQTSQHVVAPPAAPRPNPSRSAPPCIGRITGLADCQWRVLRGEGRGERGEGTTGNETPGPKTQDPRPNLLVSLGDKYRLSSGLMEITYDTGAKVILQGPCVYEVDSAAGGFLQIGKLTARVEQRREGRGGRGDQGPGVSGQIAANPKFPLPTLNSQLSTLNFPVSPGERTANQVTLSIADREPAISLAPRSQETEERGERGERRGERGEGRETRGQWSVASGQKSQEPRPKTQDLNSNYQLPTTNYQLFTVRTPSAIVTDLGTEFGVEVDRSGTTFSHVFRGSVEMRSPGASQIATTGAVVLKAGQGMSWSHRGPVTRNNSAQEKSATDRADKFVRALPRSRGRMAVPRELNLLDVVIGGNGVEHPLRPDEEARFYTPVPAYDERDRQYVRQPSDDGSEQRTDGTTATAAPKTKRSNKNPAIDGVFVAAGGEGRVTINSLGQSFNGFPVLRKIAETARGADLTPDGGPMDAFYWIYPSTGAPGAKIGLLALHANAGLTFNVAALRRAHPGLVQPLRFRATLELPSDSARDTKPCKADVWVFADGQLKYRRLGLLAADGPVAIDVELTPGARFLTLATADGRYENNRNCVVLFGDPSLEIVQPEMRKTIPSSGERRTQSVIDPR